jgi:hypothetical protein
MNEFLKNNPLVELQDIISFNRKFVIDAANDHDAAEKEQLLRDWTQEPFPDMFNKWCVVCYSRDYVMYPIRINIGIHKKSYEGQFGPCNMVCKIFQIENSENIIFKLILCFEQKNSFFQPFFSIILNNINNITNILNEFPYNESLLLRTDPVNNWSRAHNFTDYRERHLEYARYKDDADPRWEDNADHGWESISGHQYLRYNTSSVPNCELLKEQEVHRERGRGKRKKHRSKKTKKLGNL